MISSQNSASSCNEIIACFFLFSCSALSFLTFRHSDLAHRDIQPYEKRRERLSCCQLTLRSQQANSCSRQLDQMLQKWKWNVTPLLGDFGGRVGIYRFLQSPTISRRLPSLFICWELFSLCHFNSVLAHLQARGLAQGTAMSAGTWVKCKNYHG